MQQFILPLLSWVTFTISTLEYFYECIPYVEKISSYMYISELLKMEKEYGEKDTEGEFAYSLGLIFYCYFFTLLPDCCSLCPLPSLLHDNFCIRCVFYYTASGGMLHFSCRCTTVLVLRRNISPSNVKIFISITLIESK